MSQEIWSPDGEVMLGYADEELTADEVEALSYDSTGIDCNDDRFPFTYGSLTDDERTQVSNYLLTIGEGDVLD